MHEPPLLFRYWKEFVEPRWVIYVCISWRSWTKDVMSGFTSSVQGLLVFCKEIANSPMKIFIQGLAEAGPNK